MIPFDPQDTWILYDGECPFCTRYVALVRLRESLGNVRLVNARDGGPELVCVRAHQLDIDEGMVLHWNGALYHGADCIHRLALLSTPSSVFNRLNAWMFKRPAVAKVLYPWMKAGRNLVLRALGRRKIGPEPKTAP